MYVAEMDNQTKSDTAPVFDSGPEKAAYVQTMFDDIAPRYDVLNGVLSAGIHSSWRTFATRCAALQPGDSVLDVCSGTGEWTVPLRKVVGPTGKVIGLDFSFQMLSSGVDRFESAGTPRIQADACSLPVKSEQFNAVTIAFGIRNVVDQAGAFREMARVLKPGGRVVCLEFSQVKNPIFKSLYNIHSRWIMPAIGKVISGHPTAYAYLPESVVRFKTRVELADIMRSAGLSPVRMVDLMFGLVCIHVGVKSDNSLDISS
jgi:demethylmenaquinone methyltransferase/2-methoxy-6-polyprenyl-1,4-benzoquinol methylase